MTDLYPEPPHLSAFVAPALDSWEALGLAWDVLNGVGCAFAGDVLVAREREWFRDVSDVEREVIRPSGSPHDLLARRDALRIQFRHRSIGTVALGLSSAGEFGEPHPLEVAIHAGALSLPVELWSKSDRQSAKRLMGWMERLLLALVGPTRAQYGAIGIEATFPTPAVLARSQRSRLWPTTWFWSSELGSRAASEEEQLLSGLDQSALSRSNAGTIFRAWRPWSEPQADELGLDRVVGFLGRFVETSR
jgi:hypothetical protein